MASQANPQNFGRYQRNDGTRIVAPQHAWCITMVSELYHSQDCTTTTSSSCISALLDATSARTNRRMQRRNSCRWWLKNFCGFYNMNWLQNWGKRSESRLGWTHPLPTLIIVTSIFTSHQGSTTKPLYASACLPRWTIRSQNKKTIHRHYRSKTEAFTEAHTISDECRGRAGPSSGHRADRVDAAEDTRSELLTPYRS